MIEEWLDIEGFEGLYKVSNFGNIYSEYSHRVLKTKITYQGYKAVTLCKSHSIKKEFLVHRLVAIAFIPNPNNLPIVNHKDEDKGNPKADNLEWSTTVANNEYSEGSRPRKVNKLLNGIILHTYSSIAEAARLTGANRCHITSCCAGKRVTHIGYNWNYSI